MVSLAAIHHISLTRAHAEFLSEIGNGGYVNEHVFVATPASLNPEFRLRQLRGVGHPDPYLDLITTVNDYRVDGQIPKGVLPVFTDSFNTHICCLNEPIQGCHIAYWSPSDGEPDKLYPVSRNFAELLDKIYSEEAY